MTDREVLFLAYGALKANHSANPEIIKLIEKYLFPPDAPVILAETKPDTKL